MHKQIEDNIFEIHTPMLDDFRITMKAFVIKDERSPLIIDTAFNIPGNSEILLSALDDLEIDLSRARLVLTHLHPDHSGLAGKLKRKGCRVFFGHKESLYFERLNSPGYPKFAELKHRLYGLHHDTITPEDYPSLKYKTLNDFSYTTLNPGEFLSAGEFRFEVMELAGHTPGQIGLYDRKKRLLFSGDHVLDGIAPNMDYWDSDFKVIRSYRNSLKNVLELNPALSLTGHGDNLKDVGPATLWTLNRQEKRIAEILQLVHSGNETVREIASHMGWVRKFDGWNNFPSKQKWMACNQIMAFVTYMNEEKIINKEMREGVLYFTPADSHENANRQE